MSNYALESIMFIKLDQGSTPMIKALQMHFAMFEIPADLVESAIFEMYTRMDICEVHRKQKYSTMK